MVKKIRLLGMEMDNFSLREEVQQSEEFYNKQELNIIRTLSVKMLRMAADNQTVRDGIEQADLLIVGDKEILTEAGIYSSHRIREAGEHSFMYEFLSRIRLGRRSIFLIAQNKEELELLLEFLETTYEQLPIVGNSILEECGGDYDLIVNEVNAAAPDILLSVLSSPREDEFLLQAKSKIRARVWYSLGERYQGQSGKPSFMPWFWQLVHKGQLKNVIHQYEQYKSWIEMTYKKGQ